MTNTQSTNRRFHRTLLIALGSALLGCLAVAFHVAETRPDRHVAQGPVVGAPSAADVVPPSPQRMTRMLRAMDLATTTPIGPVGPEPSDSHAGHDPLAGPRNKVDTFSRRLDTLRQSGPSRPGQIEKVKSVFVDWQNTDGNGRVQFADPDCYAEGCMVSATYKSIESFYDVNQAFQASSQFRSWMRPKSRSGPISRSTGEVQATWVLYQ